MKDILRKLSSRKLWTAICGIIVGIAAAFGLDENEWAQIAGIDFDSSGSPLNVRNRVQLLIDYRKRTK